MDQSYTTQVPYLWNFYATQGPVLLNYVAKLRGLKTIDVTQPFTYCELGCGNGITSNTLAATFPHAQFYAVDFNKEHIANAKRMADKAGLKNITFIEGEFADLLKHEDLTFDFITLHGVYSWVPKSAREQIHRVAEKMIKPMGLLHLSYNTLPGWAPLAPIRQLIASFVENISTGDPLDKAKKTISYLKFLKQNDAAYFKQSVGAQEYLDKLLTNDLHYIVHEFFSASWEPFYFCDVADELKKIGLNFCGSSKVSNNYPDMMMGKTFMPLLQNCKDVRSSEMQQSLIANERLRYDIYSPQPSNPPLLENYTPFADLYIGAPNPAAIKRKYKVGTTVYGLTGEIFDDLIPALTPGNKTIAEISQEENLKKYSPQQLIKAIHRLLVLGQFQVFLKKPKEVPADISGDFKLKHEINRTLLEERIFLNKNFSLASQILGNGFQLYSFAAVILYSCEKVGRKDMDAYMLDMVDKKLPKEKAAEIREKLAEEKEKFFNNVLPALYRFDLVESTSL